MPLFEDVIDLGAEALRLRAHRHGMIEIAAGRLVRVRLRPWGRRASLLEIKTLGRWVHRRSVGDRCRLYYSQPRGMPSYLAVTYVVSGRGTTLATIRAAQVVLDEIARLRRADAIVCDVGNGRISDRLLNRWGWSPFAPSGWRRQFIKRFYGDYPPPDGSLPALLAAACESLGADANASELASSICT